MAYRLYCLDSSGRIDFAQWIEARDDSEAIRQAHDLKRHALKCEVWNGDRLIATLDARDLAC